MAGTIKGMTIEIGGNTTPLEQALKSVNKEIKGTQSELKEVDRLLKLDPKNVDLLKQKQQILGDQIGNTTKKLDALKQAQQKLDEEMKKGGEVNQQEYRKLEREIISTEGSLKKLEEANKSNNKQLKEANSHLAKFGDGLKVVGEKATASLKALTQFTVAGVKAMAGAVTGAVTAMASLAVKAGQLADDLNTMASVTGLSTKELQEFAYASDLIDVSVDTLAGALKKTTQAMSSAQSGTGKTAEAFNKLGVSVTDAQGNLRDNNDVFNEAIRALGGIANETERDALAMEIFGKSATELNPLIEGGIDTLERMGKQANELGLILSQKALDGANAFNDQLDILKANGKQTFQVIGTEIASELAPAMEQVNEYTMEVIKSLTSAMETGGLEGLIEEIANQVGNLLSKAIEMLPKIVELGSQMIQKLLEGLNQNASQIGTAGAKLISTLTQAFYSALPLIIEIATTLMVSFIQTIGEELPTLFPVILQGLVDAVHVILDNLPMIIDTVMTLIETIILTLTDPDNIGMIIDSAVDLIVALAEGLIKALPRLVERLPEIIMAIVRGLISLVTKLYEVAKPLLIALGDGILNAVGSLWEAITGVWEYIKSSFVKAFTQITEVGKYLIEGLWNGIVNAKDWLINKIKSFCSDALGAIKAFFGIESPSKVMANEVGKYMAEGIGVGFSKTMPSVIDAMKDKLSVVTDAMQTELSFDNIPQIQGNQIISENQYVTRNYTNTVETIRQPQTVELVLDGTKLARTLIQPLDSEYNRLGVKI